MSPDRRILIVADGMGGHACGEVASRLATEVVAGYLSLPERQGAMGADPGSAAPAILSEALQQAHAAVSRADRQTDERRRMGTALIVAFLTQDRVCTAHVGDVRCYLGRPPGVRVVTRDHTRVGQWVEDGRMTAEQARRSPQRNQLSQAIGASAEILPEVHTEGLEPGDWLLLCSDGLWSALPDTTIVAALSGAGSAREQAGALAAAARAAGSPDDLSLILYRHGPAAYSS